MKWLVLMLVTFSAQASLDDLENKIKNIEERLKIFKEESKALHSLKIPEEIRKRGEELMQQLDELEYEDNQVWDEIENYFEQKKQGILGEIELLMFQRKK